jgi:hypothetical protein
VHRRSKVVDQHIQDWNLRSRHAVTWPVVVIYILTDPASFRRFIVLMILVEVAIAGLVVWCALDPAVLNVLKSVLASGRGAVR